jgi:hypothetical protein
MVPSAGVAEPHREFWLLTHRTDVGTARPPRYLADSRAACSARAASVAGRLLPAAARRSPWRCSLATILCTHSASWAAVNRAGIATTAVPFSQKAATVRVRRDERRTTTGAPSSVVMEEAALCAFFAERPAVTARCFPSGHAGRPPHTVPALKGPPLPAGRALRATRAVLRQSPLRLHR